METSVYSSTSIEGESSAATGGSAGSSASPAVKFKSESSAVGLPGNSALSLGFLLGDHWDLGARLGYASGSVKTGAESLAVETETSQVTLAPFLAYVAGSRESRARFTLGITAGLGSGSAKTTTPSTTTTTSANVSESTLSSTQYGAFLGLRGFLAESMSLDPMLMLAHTSATYKVDEGAELDLAGTTVMLNVGFTFWTHGSDTPAPPVAAGAASPATPSAAPPADTTAPAAQPAALVEPSADANTGPVERTDRITLPVGQGNAVTIIRDPKGDAEPSVTLVFREEGAEGAKNDCTEVKLHSPNQQETAVAVTPGMASTSGRRFPILKGKVSVEHLRWLVVTPLAASTSAPDHWFDVCNKRWHLHEQERGRLKNFVDQLPATAVTPNPGPAL